jgi:uncharacterized circularly permuted ATP-grasp superfamily protein/uncharacterized alpha-E superfamily protein
MADGSPGNGQDAVYDEMVTGKGQVRAHWQRLMSTLSPLDPVALEDRRDEAVQLLRQHGVTYAIYGDPQGAERPWPLDLLPFVISAQEWRTIEAGVIQRTRLLNDILGDIYGPQRLIADGRLPPSLLHANPSFLHPCARQTPAGGTYLHFTAFDLCRAGNGQWHILSDRTQAPSGAGYALENRSVVGRVLADCIGAGSVQPLAPFFAAFRESLTALLPGDGSARVVLLTPGPFNETYFEHVYLARQLDITLVEGNDLTVRDRHVYLKTLSGLEKVGVILRRLDDDFCDPIELKASSALGVPGLVEVVRAGNVVMANALGSGVLEAAAFKPLLAGLAPSVIGEDLSLPDIPTWWCNGDSNRAYVLDNLDDLVIKRAFASYGGNPVFGGRLSRAERAALTQNIKTRPMDFVGQQRAQLSTAPVWNGQRLEPRAMVLRVFVAAIGGNFAVMPGGLTRTAPGDEPVVSMQLGGGSKDSWVMTATDDPDTATAAPVWTNKVAQLPRIHFHRSSGGELPSRVADSLFWVGRYAERTDGVVRLLRSLLMGVTDAAQPWRYRDAEPVLNLAAWLELIPPIEHAHAFQPISLVQAALLDHNHPSGVVASVQRLINAARRVRDHLSADCWRIFMALDRQISQPLGRAPPVRLLLKLDELVMLGAALAGATAETMPRDAGWRFLEIGRRIERAIYLVTAMRGLTAPPLAELTSQKPIEERRLLSAMMALTDSRGTSNDAGQPGVAVERASLLSAILDNEADPRSLSFQLSALSEHLSLLPRPAAGARSGGGLIDTAITLTQSARVAIPEAIANASQSRSGRAASGDPLRPAFAGLDILVPQISDLLTQAYFTHVLVRSA